MDPDSVKQSHIDLINEMARNPQKGTDECLRRMIRQITVIKGTEFVEEEVKNYRILEGIIEARLLEKMKGKVCGVE